MSETTPAAIDERTSLNPTERRASMALTGIFSLRMMGLFLVLPVLALYAQDLPGATPALVGTAIGIYGLTQALLQIAFGAASDRIGRKSVITFGMLLFTAGSLLCAGADTIGAMIVGRMLQGSGAVAAAVTALIADSTRDEVRTRAMAMLGGGIALSFAVSLVAGPILAATWGVPFIFKLVAVLSLAAIVVLWIAVPTPPTVRHHRDASVTRSDLKKILADPNLRRLDACAFFLHMALTAMFVSVPVLLARTMDPADFWKVYLPVILVSFAIMVPTTIMAETRGMIRQVTRIGIAIVALSFVVLAFGMDSQWGVIAGLMVFFIGFNMLEPILPSMVTKFSPAGAKGTGSGVFNTFQFLGPFVGGVVGGAVLGYGPRVLFVGLFVICILWLIIVWGLSAPIPYRQMVVTLHGADGAIVGAAIEKLDGVGEVRVYPNEGQAHVRFISKEISPERILEVAQESGAVA